MASFAPLQHAADYQSIIMSQQHGHPPVSPSSPGRSKFWPFNRSRSSSPNLQPLDAASRSRKSSGASFGRGSSPSAAATTSGFVVRNVVRQPGGVSAPASPIAESSSPGFRLPSAQSPSRTNLDGQSDLQYRRSKSKPLSASLTLGVPPGGPGGGVGYGTATSSNDGRPEPFHSPLQQPNYHRSASPASTTAGGFQKAIRDRGRSPAKPNSYQDDPHSDIRSSPSNENSRPAATKKTIKAIITAGPHSYAQQSQTQQPPIPQQAASATRTSFQSSRSQIVGGPRQFPGASPSAFTPQIASSPTRPQPLGNLNGFGPPTASFSPMPPVPLDGLPSPVDIPYGRSPQGVRGARSRSRDPGAETDYSYQNGASPFGSVSPAAPPGFLSTLASRSDDRDQRRRSVSPGPTTLAGKWFKGIFGRSPRPEDQDSNWQGATTPYPNANQDWSRGPSPMPDEVDEASHRLQHSQASHHSPNVTRRSQTLPSATSEDDIEAIIQKRQSMRQARRIVDAERKQLLEADSSTTRFDPDQDQEFRPKQQVDTGLESEDNEAAVFETQRTKSPPGRKPVPKLAPEEHDPGDPDGRLTPAQRIIQETRSKHLAYGQTEDSTAPNRPAHETGNGTDLARNVQRGFSGPPVAENPKPTRNQVGSTAATTTANVSREAANQQPNHLQAPASKAALATPSKDKPSQQNRGPDSTLAPGTGPMPLEMSLPQALQEMMVRFYRFERYSVPLIRSLETRLLDIERDAMMACNPQSGARNAKTASQHEEMDRWVGQMTRLMKYEAGQLKAATREIRQGRELVACVAKNLGSLPGGVVASTSLSSLSSLHQSLTVVSTPSRLAEPEVVQGDVTLDSPSSTKADAGIAANQNGVKPFRERQNSVAETSLASTVGKVDGSRDKRRDTAAGRQTNISSSSFHSAVTRAANQENLTSLTLPPGSKPALSKDEGKYGMAHSHERERNERSTSPNGRTRYTSALGQPMRNGRISPLPRVASPLTLSQREEELDVQRMASPTLSEQASIHSGFTYQTKSGRERSVEDRLKALVDGRSTRSRSSSVAGSIPEMPSDEDQGAGESQRIGDDYRPTPERQAIHRPATSGTLKKSARSTVQHTQETSTDSARTIQTTTIAKTGRALVAKKESHQVGNSPSSSAPRRVGNQTSRTDIAKRASKFLEAPEAERQPPTHDGLSDATLPCQKEEVDATIGLLGGRSSPSPSSFSALRRKSTGAMSGAESTAGQMRERPVSPGIPLSDGTITTSSHASVSIKARAMNYLNSAEATHGNADLDRWKKTPLKRISLQTLPTTTLAHHDGDDGDGDGEDDDKDDVVTQPPSAATRISFPSTLSTSPKKESTGGISPMKLYSNRFAKTETNRETVITKPSSPLQQSKDHVLAERKRNFSVPTPLPSSPSSKPVIGYGASLMERVAFFDNAK